MFLNLPIEVWYVFIGAGSLFLFPLLLLAAIYLIFRTPDSAGEN